MYGPCSSLAAPASLPVSPSLPVPPFTPLAVPPATPLPLKSFSLVTALDRSIVGSFVGIATGGGMTWKPFGGAGASTLGASTFNFGGSGVFGFGFGGSGFLGGGGSSFFGGGGSFFISMNRTFSDLTLSALRVPARAVAKTARKITRTCNITLEMVPPTDRFFLFDFVDSSRCIIEGSPDKNALLYRATALPAGRVLGDPKITFLAWNLRCQAHQLSYCSASV